MKQILMIALVLSCLPLMSACKTVYEDEDVRVRVEDRNRPEYRYREHHDDDDDDDHDHDHEGHGFCPPGQGKKGHC